MIGYYPVRTAGRGCVLPRLLKQGIAKDIVVTVVEYYPCNRKGSGPAVNICRFHKIFKSFRVYPVLQEQSFDIQVC